MRKAERKKVDSFEMWCWRRVVRVSWMERKTNVRVLENIKPEWTLGRTSSGMENDVMLGEMSGKRRLSPRAGHDSTAQGDLNLSNHSRSSPAIPIHSSHVLSTCI